MGVETSVLCVSFCLRSPWSLIPAWVLVVARRGSFELLSSREDLPTSTKFFLPIRRLLGLIIEKGEMSLSSDKPCLRIESSLSLEFGFDLCSDCI